MASTGTRTLPGLHDHPKFGAFYHAAARDADGGGGDRLVRPVRRLSPDRKATRRAGYGRGLSRRLEMGAA